MVLCACLECRIAAFLAGTWQARSRRSVAEGCALCFWFLSRLSPVVLLASPAVVDTLAMAPMLQEQLVHHSSLPRAESLPP